MELTDPPALRCIDVSGRVFSALREQSAPQLQWLPIAALRIDDRYQRSLAAENWRHIQRIAADFRWALFAPVIVAPVPAGLFAVIDGQHRVHAAALCGIDSVPCMVVPIPVADQAQAFMGVNQKRVGVTSAHVLRAALIAGEPWAEACRDCVAAAGCTLMTVHVPVRDRLAGQVFSVGLVRGLVARGHGLVVTRALAALMAAHPAGSPILYENATLEVLFDAVADVDVETLTGFLRSVPILPLIETARTLAAKEGRPKRPAAVEALTQRLRRHIAKVAA